MLQLYLEIGTKGCTGTCAPGTAAMPADRGSCAGGGQAAFRAIVAGFFARRSALARPARPRPADDVRGWRAIIQVSGPWLAMLPSLMKGYWNLQQFRLPLKLISTQKHPVVEEVIVPQSGSGLMRAQIRK